MLIAIETSGRSGSLALVLPDGRIDEITLEEHASTAARLIPTLDRLLARHGLRPHALQAIAVTVGPGSFTGLRVGVTTAKALAYATGAALIGVDTLQVIAEQSPDDVDDVWAVVDAQRGQLYAARWELRGASWVMATATTIVDVHGLTRLSTGALVSGPGCALLVGADAKRMTPREAWTPRAETIARLGLRRWSRGEVDDPWQLAPQYIRRAAAEEKAAQLSASATRAE